MSTSKSLDIRWIRRYKGFCIAGCVFLIIQVFLAYIFFTLHSEEPKDVQEYLTGYRKINFEAFEDRNGAESSRRFKENYLALEDDEEEGPGNSNAVEHRLKVPPDKPDEKSDDKVPVKSKGENRLSDGPSRTSGNKTSMLRLEELDFMPLCDIVGKEAISAIHRAKTQHCKQQLANITCLNIRGDLYPQWLPHTCPNNGYEAGKLLGCYKDDKAFRLLSGYYNNLKTSNSPQYCINLCLQSGFPFAGVQYMSECFCGNEEPLSTARLPDSSCNMKCPGDPKEACGGNYTMNIYQTGIAKFSPQPPNEPGTSVDRERPVRIAFLLTLNGRAVRQVYRLLKALFHKDHYFYIHIDSRQDYMFRELLALEMRLSNVRLSRRRHSTIWGGASLLTMLLESMLELVQADWDWDFVINLSESDFPVKTNMQLVEFLMANRERNFVKSHGREVQRFIQKQGLDKTFVECEAHMWRAGDRTLPWGIAMDGGSDWVALSRSFINYVTAEHKDRLISGLLTVFKYTLLPAEKQGLDKTFVECEAHMWRAGDRTLPWGIAMDGGSDWVALSRSFINYVTAEHKDRLISGLLTVFKYTLLPAESFFHTVLRNSEFCGSYVDNNLHVTNWKRRLGCKCQYKHVVDWCGCSPNNFKTEDWPRLQGTEARPLFFARKFEPIINQAIILQLEEWLYGTYPSNLTGLNSYWQSVYHYQDLSPASDDSLNTYVVSLTRLAARVLSNSVPDCLISPGKVLEVTSYLHNDKYKGTLIKYEARVKHLQSDIQLETWVRPHNNFSVFSSFGPAKRLKMMLVSSDYDQKEQTSRNLLRSLSIFSEPYLVYHFLSGTSAYNVTFLWIDPVGSLADVSEAYVDEVATINGVKASLKTPLLPGVWLLKMVYNNTVVAQTDFLVSPLQFSSGTAVTQQQAGLLHSGPGHPYKVTKDVSSLRKLIGVPNSTLQTRAAANAKRFGKDLVQWIDSLIVRFYTLVDSCVVSTQTVNVCKSLQLEPCRSTVWSSMAPDPKSTITTINKATGRLNRW